MSTSMRAIIWWILIIGAVVIGIGLVASAHDRAAGIWVVLSIATWTGWWCYSSWLFGLRRHVRAHMSAQVEDIAYISKEVGVGRLSDYIRTLDELSANQSDGTRLGASGYAKLAQIKSSNLSRCELDWRTIEAADGELINIAENPFYLLRCDDIPFVAKVVRHAEHEFLGDGAIKTDSSGVLDLAAGSLAEANQVTHWLNELVAESSVYKNKLLFVSSPAGTIGQAIRIQSPQRQERSEIVLPDATLELVERLVISHSEKSGLLNRLGHRSGLGILLYGPPGTGKTLVIRFLADQCRDERTTIVPSDLHVETIRESFRLANYLQPAMLILEDVDLLAEKRDASSHSDGLQELMNQMDGLNRSSDVIVVMSTNRPEVLEPALAARPGRISQAIEFDLPDGELRLRLLRLFLDGAAIDDVDLDHWVQRTEGASPAFIRELCRRAILHSSSDEEKMVVLNDDLNSAIHEIVVIGGTLNSAALGFPQGKGSD